MAISPMVAGLLAHAGIRSVFLVDGAMLLIFGVAVRQVMEEPTGVAASPADGRRLKAAPLVCLKGPATSIRRFPRRLSRC
jgi:hypothetical protein